MQGFRGLFAGDVLQYKLNGVRVPAGTQAVELMLDEMEDCVKNYLEK